MGTIALWLARLLAGIAIEFVVPTAFAWIETAIAWVHRRWFE